MATMNLTSPATTTATSFTAQEVADFQEGKLELRGSKRIQMQEYLRKEIEVEAAQMITDIKNGVINPDLDWAKNDANGDPLDWVAIDITNFDPTANAMHEAIWNGAMQYCRTSASGLRAETVTGKLISASAPFATGYNNTKKNIACTVEMPDGTQITANISHENVGTMQPLCKIGAAVSVRKSQNGSNWVQAVMPPSAETLAEQAKLEGKAKEDKVFENGLTLKAKAFDVLASSGGNLSPEMAMLMRDLLK